MKMIFNGMNPGDRLIKDRLEKLKKYEELFGSAYPARVSRTGTIANLLAAFSKLESENGKIFAVGRIFSVRDQGKIVFVDFRDETSSLQALLRSDDTEDFESIKNLIDAGDFVEVMGTAVTTNRGEKSILARRIRVAAKCLKPWPSQWFGLEDVEARQRKRYLDLVFHPEAKQALDARIRVTAALRNILSREGFVEVETPILQPVPGGALAKPFATHFNALDINVFLRVAPELYLKRLLAAGYEKIFEVAKDFRNEGVDRDHYPEFTMLELYWAYQDYESLTAAAERWIKEIASSLGLTKIAFRGKELEIFFQDWPRRDYAELIMEYCGRKITDMKVEEIDELFKKQVRPNLIEPVFVVNYPKAISPLTKSRADNPDVTERSQLIIAGSELTNCFSELNNPIDQRERMLEQERRHRAGDPEASRLDEEFLEAVEYGMPPAAGIGIGIDRLAAVLTDSRSIRDVITFTNLRPKENRSGDLLGDCAS